MLLHTEHASIWTTIFLFYYRFKESISLKLSVVSELWDRSCLMCGMMRLTTIFKIIMVNFWKNFYIYLPGPSLFYEVFGNFWIKIYWLFKVHLGVENSYASSCIWFFSFFHRWCVNCSVFFSIFQILLLYGKYRLSELHFNYLHVW